MKINPPPLSKKTPQSLKPLKKWWGIFRAYDIRGIYPEEINEVVAYKIGRAFVKFLKKSTGKRVAKLNIVVGRDNRLSSPSLFKAIIKGIITEGAKVIDIGMSSTPMLYFAVAHYKFAGGIEITASHNPPQWNGLKLVGEKGISISENTGLKEIRELTEEITSRRLRGKGQKVKKEILKDYLKFNLKEFDLKKFQPLKVVIDTANGVAGPVVAEIFQKIPGQIYHLFARLDGNFPNHPPDPLKKENLRWLRKEVKEKRADLGVAFDGDGDRIIFVDENGQIIPPDLITALMAKIILEKKPGEKILYDVCSNNIIKEIVEKTGGLPVLGRVGHSFIREKIRKENIIFAGEFSGHYYLREYYFSEAPFFVLFKILEELSKTEKTLSSLIKPFRKYFHSEGINFKVKDQKRILELLEKKYKNGKVLKIDGLRIDFPDWWFNIRPSQTEPVLRLVLEAKTKKLMKKKKKEIVKLLVTPEVA